MSGTRDLVCQAENATAGGQYRGVRDLADELVDVAEGRAELRTAHASARARDESEPTQASAQQPAPDDATAT